MKRDLNFIFLILILITLVLFVGFSTFYQMRFYNLSESYNTKLSQLEKVTGELQLNKNILNETSVELEVRAERASDLQTKYDKLRSDKEKVDAERDKLEKDLFDAKTEIADRITKMSQMQQDLDKKDADLKIKDDQIVSLQSDANKWEKRYNDCDASLKACEQGG